MTLVVRIQFWNYSSLFTMNRVNFNNFRPSISRVSSIETHTRGRNFVPKVILRRDGGQESALTHLTRERSWYYGASPRRSDRAWPRVLAVTVSEWRLHVSLCGAFHVLIVRLSVSPFGRARTGRRISPTPRRRPLLAVKTLRGTYGDDSWEKGHHEDHHETRMTPVPPRFARTRVKVKAEATMPDGSVADVERRNN